MSDFKQERSTIKRYVGGIWVKEAKTGEKFLTLGFEDKNINDQYFNGSLVWKDKEGQTYLVKGLVAFKNKRYAPGSAAPQFQLCLELDNPRHAIMLSGGAADIEGAPEVTAQDDYFDEFSQPAQEVVKPAQQAPRNQTSAQDADAATKKLAAAQAALRDRNQARQQSPGAQTPRPINTPVSQAEAEARAKRAELLKRYQ